MGKPPQWKVIVLLCLVAGAVALAEPRAYTTLVDLDSVQEPIVVPLELIPLRQTQRPIGPAKTAVYDARDYTLREASLRLVITRYWCKYLKLHDGRAFETAHQLWCYELLSEPQEDGFVYMWSTWRPVGTEDGPFEFRLFTPQGGRSYLTWTSGWRISVADVSHSRDRSVALQEYLSHAPGRGVQDVPVDSLPPEMTTYWKRARFSEFTPWMVQIESLTRDEEGRLKLALRERMAGGRAVLIQQKDGEWTLGSYTPAPKGAPEAPADQGSEAGLQ